MLMKTVPEAKGPEYARPHPHASRLRACLWLLIGALVGSLLVGLGNQWREAGRLEQAKIRISGKYQLQLPKIEQQLAGIEELQAGLETELAAANAAAAAGDIKLSVYRSKIKRIRTQLDQTEQALRQLTKVTAAELVGINEKPEPEGSEEQQRHSELELQVGQSRQDLSALETRLDALAAYWTQLVAREAEAAKQTEVAKVRTEAAAEVRRAEQESRQVESTSILLAGALQRLEAETERARAENLRQTATETLHQVQFAAARPPPAPTLCLQRPAPYYSYDEPYYYSRYNYYSDRYRLRPYLSYRMSPTWVYGSRPPVMHRFGPYLVVGD